MSLQETVIYEEDIVVALGGLDTTAAITIDRRSFAASISFPYGRRRYSFGIIKWSGTGFYKFIKLFHEADSARDADVFGTPLVDGGATTLFATAQCLRAMVQACRDILALLDRILAARGKDTFSYAVWYRENHREQRTYSQYIARIACKCIARTNFLVCDSAYDVVD